MNCGRLDAIRRLGGMMMAAAMALSLLAAPADAGTAPPRPKLFIVISVDQFSAALFDQYRSRFSAGLKRLETQGVVFPNGYQSHAATETCPGHSTLLTGRHPSATGIIANDWRDRATGRNVYCVFDPSHPVPGRADQPRGPANLRVSTFGDWLKAADPRSRVVGVSGKDRAAIMMTGHHPDAVFWWDDERGFNTYVPAGRTAAAQLKPVAGFNDRLFAQWHGRPPAWQPIDSRCGTLAGPHSYGDLTIDHRVPPPMNGNGDFMRDAATRQWFRASPALDSVTMALAEKLIVEMKLGRGAAPDLLAISLSATDYIGHLYGNQGPEMCDQLAHLDRLIGTLLDRLDAMGVTALVTLSADHGSIDAAERVAERGFAAERTSPAAMVKAISRSVRDSLKLDFDPLAGDGQQFYVTSSGSDPALKGRIIAAAVAALKRHAEIAAVFTADEIAATTSPRDKPVDELTLAERMAESYDAQRSGDILVAYRPYMSFGIPSPGRRAIAGHGSPWNYDRRVPILFWWPGVQGFEQALPVETVDIAPTLAGLAGITPPPVDGVCRDLDRGSASSCPITHEPE